MKQEIWGASKGMYHIYYLFYYSKREHEICMKTKKHNREWHYTILPGQGIQQQSSFIIQNIQETIQCMRQVFLSGFYNHILLYIIKFSLVYNEVSWNI